MRGPHVLGQPGIQRGVGGQVGSGGGYTFDEQVLKGGVLP